MQGWSNSSIASSHFRPSFSFPIASDWARALWMLGYHLRWFLKVLGASTPSSLAQQVSPSRPEKALKLSSSVCHHQRIDRIVLAPTTESEGCKEPQTRCWSTAEIEWRATCCTHKSVVHCSQQWTVRTRSTICHHSSCVQQVLPQLRLPSALNRNRWLEKF